VFTTDDAKILNVSFTPYRVEFAAIVGREPAEIVLNQNYAPGWRSTAGAVVLSQRFGRPPVTLGAGQAGKFSFAFVPPGLLLGLTIFGAGAIVSWFLWDRRVA
jgi:hypothetical protein